MSESEEELREEWENSEGPPERRDLPPSFSKEGKTPDGEEPTFLIVYDPDDSKAWVKSDKVEPLKDAQEDE